MRAAKIVLAAAAVTVFLMAGTMWVTVKAMGCPGPRADRLYRVVLAMDALALALLVTGALS